MVMRWLMRGMCLVLLAGVVGVWVGSYAGTLTMRKWSAGRDWLVGAVQGLGFMARSDDMGLRAMPLKFDFIPGGTARGLRPRTLGFYGGPWSRQPDSWQVVFPLWLPTLLLVALNGFVWRWTRRRQVGARAVGFPVEPAKKADA